MRSPSTEASHLGFTKPSSCYTRQLPRAVVAAIANNEMNKKITKKQKKIFAYIGVARVGVSRHVKFYSDYQIVTSLAPTLDVTDN